MVTPPLPSPAPCAAYDILSNPKTRMSFDSVDPQNDDSVPPNNAHSKENFFAAFAPVFESNTRCTTARLMPPQQVWPHLTLVLPCAGGRHSNLCLSWGRRMTAMSR